MHVYIYQVDLTLISQKWYTFYIIAGYEERPSIGLLLCARRDKEVVKYALSRSLFHTMIAKHKTMLPDKKMHQAKSHEFSKIPDPPENRSGKEKSG